MEFRAVVADRRASDDRLNEDCEKYHIATRAAGKWSGASRSRPARRTPCVIGTGRRRAVHDFLSARQATERIMRSQKGVVYLTKD
jgi:hypothetical protein